MSKFISFCIKNLDKAQFQNYLEPIAERLIPENFTPNSPRFISGEGITTLVLNPLDDLEVKDQSVCVGIMTEKPLNWYQPGGGVPDGNFALIRADQNTLELVTDAASTRAIWYYKDEDIFIASTSQRAIIMLLGSFEPNEATYSWFLTSGWHGPDMGWDRRLRYVHSNQSQLRLNRNTWELVEETPPFQFKPIKKTSEELYEFYQSSIKATFSKLNLDPEYWALPLSGGYDSRALLLLLSQQNKYKTITWGQKSSENIPLSDNYVARKLSKKLNLPHRFYPLDVSDEPFDDVFHRFLIVGEGRMDRIAGYLDGFDIWNQFFNENIQGIIRGDLAFSQSNSPQEMKDVYAHLSSPDFKSVFPNIDYQEWGFQPKIFPDYLQRKEGETLQEYRDRLFILYRGPNRISAYNDVKLTYTETLQPFFFKELIDLYLQLPNQNRGGKEIQKKLVNDLGPAIEFASIDNGINMHNFLRSKEITNYMLDMLADPSSQNVLPEKFLNFLLQNIKVGKENYHEDRYSLGRIWKKKLKKMLPNNLLKYRKPLTKGINVNEIAFRACIILKMNKILKEDSMLFRHKKYEYPAIEHNS